MRVAYLKFADAAQGRAALTAAGLLTPTTQDGSLDIVGTIYTPAVMSGMIVITPAVALTGWHVNWIGEILPASLAAYEIQPATPSRVFAGWHPDEIAARAAK